MDLWVIIVTMAEGMDVLEREKEKDVVSEPEKGKVISELVKENIVS
jgi:hypothetical protein